MKTTVQVTLVVRSKVQIDVEHADDEDPCDLTPADRQRAIEDSDIVLPDLRLVDVDRVEVVR